MTTAFEREEKEITPAVSASPMAGATSNGNPAFWARLFATGGAIVWVGLALAARSGMAPFGAIELMFLFAPLVILPLGMELGRVTIEHDKLAELAQRTQPAGALFAVIAMCLPPGSRAGALACGWLTVCLFMAGGAALRMIRTPWSKAAQGARARFADIALAVGQIDLAVGGAWFVASRAGMRPMGIQEPIGLLTAVHFHFAGFATATIAGTTLFFAEKFTSVNLKWLRRIAMLAIVLPFLVAAGFVIAPIMKMIAAILFSVSVIALAVFLWKSAGALEDPTARFLLQVAVGAVFAAMSLSATYAVADFAGRDWVTIPQMARTHGVLNAVGFCLCGLLGWIVELERRCKI